MPEFSFPSELITIWSRSLHLVPWCAAGPLASEGDTLTLKRLLALLCSGKHVVLVHLTLCLWVLSVSECDTKGHNQTSISDTLGMRIGHITALKRSLVIPSLIPTLTQVQQVLHVWASIVSPATSGDLCQ